MFKLQMEVTVTVTVDASIDKFNFCKIECQDGFAGAVKLSDRRIYGRFP